MIAFQCIAIWEEAQPDRGLLSRYWVNFRARNEPRVGPANDRSNGIREGTGKGVGSALAAGVYNCAVFERKKEIQGETPELCVASRARGLRFPWGMAK